MTKKPTAVDATYTTTADHRIYGDKLFLIELRLASTSPSGLPQTVAETLKAYYQVNCTDLIIHHVPFELNNEDRVSEHGEIMENLGAEISL